MRSWKVGSIIIIEEGRPVGIVTEKDLVEKVVAEDKLPAEVKAQRRHVRTRGDQSVPGRAWPIAGSKMARLRLRRLPVVVGGELVGMLTENDITRLSPSLIEITREWKSINAPADGREGAGVPTLVTVRAARTTPTSCAETGGASGRASTAMPGLPRPLHPRTAE